MDEYLPDRIVRAARSYLGVKWKHLGRDHNGLDCAGLVIQVSKLIGYYPPDFNTDNYSRFPDGYNFMNYFKEHLTQVPNNTVTKGDVLVIKSASRYPCHCGIYNREENGYETVIHACAQSREVVEEPYQLMRLRHVGTFRFVMNE